MSAIADAIEFFLHIFAKDSGTKPSVERSTLNAGVGFCYLTFGFGWLVVWTKFSNKSFSAILTAASLVQLLGFLCLTVKVRGCKSVAGISSKTLELYALTLICRLTSTLWKSGYIPVDRSGRDVYQAMDACALCVVFQLLWCIHKTHKWTYQAEHDSFPIFPLIPPCVVLGYFFHAGLNRSDFFDTIWASSMNLDTVAMLPQLWMLTKIGGEVVGCTGHWIAAILVSRAMSMAFWYSAYKDLTAEGAGTAGQAILIAHALQLCLGADFLYFYVRAKFSGQNIRLPPPPGSSQEDSYASPVSSSMDI